MLKPQSLDGTLGEACNWALQNAYRWTERCTKAWLDKNPSDLSGPFAEAIYKMPPPELGSEQEQDAKRLAYQAAGLYKQTWSEWNKSSTELGIVEVGEKREKQIHLWRAKGTIKDYICPGGRKRSEVNDLVKRLQGYLHGRHREHPFNCLFLAEPGWGKTRLARCLAQHFDFVFLNYSIAEMGSNQDLKNCLTEIVSTQNRTRKRVLVFVDEIDAQIESHTAMGLLLGPIWGGSFLSNGEAYRIDPCVWVFASTKSPSRLRAESKGRDFLSRINGPILELDFLTGRERDDLDHARSEDERIRVMAGIFQHQDNHPLRTELVYHGVSFLNDMVGPISSVDQSVLQIFYDTMPIDGIRSVEVFASRFRDISRGRVFRRNVPDPRDFPELDRHIHVVKVWPKEDQGAVRVAVHPPK